MRNNIRENIESGEISDRLSRQKYSRHIEGTPEFERYVSKQEAKGMSRPSKLYLSYDEAQEVIRQYAGTGDNKRGASLYGIRQP